MKNDHLKCQGDLLSREAAHADRNALPYSRHLPRMRETMPVSELLGRKKSGAWFATVWHKLAQGGSCPPGAEQSPVRIFRKLLPVLLFGAILAGTDAQAEPTGGEVVFGDADIIRSNPKQSDIIQRSDKAIIDWNTFSIDADELVRFQQPSSKSIALNRVRSNAVSQILGRLTADGRVMLINPNGILFGKDAQVDVGSLVATTIDIDNEDFIAGRFNFDDSLNPSAAIINRGGITAAEGGIVALVAPGVENSGVISARLGRVTLASGNLFTLDFYGDSLIKIGVDDRVTERLFAPDGTELKSLVSNSGSILADGGMVVLMAAGAAKDMVDYAINMDGIIEAKSATKRNGRIVLEGLGEGIVRVAGDLDASGRGSGESGGSVKVLGSKVGLVGQVKVDVSGDQGGGEALIGGNFQGKGPERNAVLTVIGDNASILADTLTVGTGGRVIAWSDNETRFFGSVSARGGKNSGNGGFAEISGLQHLQFVPTSIDLGASNGLNGKLLLDPRDVVIEDGSGADNALISSTATHLSFSTGTATTDYAIEPSAFEAINADVTIQATRDIKVNSPIDRSGSNNSTLSLQAGRHLIIKANITGTNGNHSFIFEADSPQSGANNDGTGKLEIRNVQITSNNGNITLIGAKFIIDTTSTGTATSINAGTGSIYIAPSRTTAAMNIGANNDNLNPAEISRFAAGTIYIGTATTGPTGTAGGSGIGIKAASITVNQAVTISGSVVFDSSGTTTLKANVATTGGGNITFEDAVSLTGDVTATTGTSGGNITFKSTVNGAFGLTLIAGTGAVDLQGAAGGATKLTDLAITSGNVTLGAVTLGGTLTLTSTGTITLKGNINIDDNAVSFERPVVLGGNVTIFTNADNDGVAGKITFTSTINGARSLSLDAGSAAVDLQGAVGGTTSLVILTVNGGQIDLASAATRSNISVTGTNIDLNATAYNSNNGNIKFTGPVDLHANVTVNSDANNSGADGNITFTSTVNSSGSARTLTLDADAGGAVNLQGAVGGTTKLSSLTVTGGQIDLKAVATSGAIAITGTNIDLNGATYNSDDGNIKFTGPVDLHASVTVNSDADTDTTDGDITFTSTVNGRRTLTLNAGTGDVTVSGAMGGTTGLSYLTVTGAAVSLKSVSVDTTITVTGTTSITLNGNYYSNDGNIKFTGAVTLAGAVSVDSDHNNAPIVGSITFTSTVNGAYSLTLDANTSTVDLQGAVGGTTPLASLTVDGDQIDLKAVATSGAIDIEGTNIDLNGATYKSNDGNIKFTGPVDLETNVSINSDEDNDSTDGSITFTSTVNGGRRLTLDADTGAVELQGAVGGTTALASLTVDGGQIDLNTVATTGNISIEGSNIDLNAATYNSDDGNITFTGAVDLHANVTVDSDADNDSVDGSITFTSTVDSNTNTSWTLTLDADSGAVNLQGAVGGTQSPRTLTVDGAQIDLNSVAIRGDISIEGTNIDLNGATYSSDDDGITFTGPVDLHAGVTVNSNGDNGAFAGGITFTSTVNGAQSLTLNASATIISGAVNLQGAVGGTTKLTSLTVTGNQIDLKAVATSGAIAITGMNIDLNGATYNSDDGNITFTGAVDLHANVSVDSDKDDDTTDGDITFTSTIDSSGSARTLTLDASTGAVNLQGAVGGTDKLTSLTVIGGQIDLSTVATTGAIAITGTNIDLNGATYESDDGDITFTGPVDLHTNVTVDSDKDGDSTDGDITFSSTATVNGTYSLMLDAGTGAVNLQGAVGGTAKPASLTVSGAQIDLKAVATSGAIAITGTNIDLNGATYNSDDGNITFTGPVDLTVNVSVDSDKDDDDTDGSITFTSTINGAKTLTLDASTGAVNLQGAVGGTTKLTSLTVSGGQIDLKAVATTGAIAITGTNIDLNGATYNSDDGDITFTGPVDLHTNVTVDSDKDGDTTDGDITFTSTINGAYSLTLDAHTGAVELQGAVGGTASLTNLTITSANVTLGAVTLSGTLTLTSSGTITLKGNITVDDTALSFSRPVVLGANVTIDTDGDNDGTDGSITFTSTINGAYSLTLDADTGAVDLQGAVGGTTKLASLTVDGGQIDLKAVATTGAIDIEGTNIDLNGATYNSDDGNIKFTGPVDLTVNVSVDSDKDDDSTDGSITFTSTVDGAKTLTLDASTGAVNLQGAVGGTTKLTSLTITGGQIDLSTVATSGAIAITGTNIDLNGATYNSDDGNIKFTGPVDLTVNVSVDSDKDDDTTDGSITFTSTINGAKTLTLDASTGAVNLQGAVGGTTKLASLTVTGGQIDLSTVATSGAIAITGTNIDLNGTTYNSDDGNIKFTGPVDLHANVSVDSDKDDDTTDGDITFTSTINSSGSARTLTLDASTGAVNLQGAAGGSMKLASLTVTGGQIDLSTVATSGAIAITGTNIDLNGATYNSDDGNIKFTGPVDLTVNVSVDSDKDDDTTDGSITFTSTVDGAKTLTLDASTGAVNLQGAVGGTTKLTSLTITGGTVSLKSVSTTGAFSVTGTGITLNGNYFSDDNNIKFTGPVTLAGAVSVDSDADNDSTDGSITFTSTINGAYSLTLDASTGAVDLQGAVGGTTKLASLTVSGAQIDLKAVATTGAIAITGTNIDLNGTTYNSDDGNIKFTGPVDLTTNVSVDSDKDDDTTDGDITFTSTINSSGSARTLTLDASTGAVNLQGAVGGTTKLASLTVTGGQIDLSTVATTGAIAITGTNIDLNGATYNSDDGNIKFTGPVDLTVNVSVDSDKDDDTTDGSITFTSTVDGAKTLTLDASTGAVNLQGAVGGTTKLTSLTITGGQIDLSTVATTGAIAITGTNIDLNGATYNSDDGNIKFTGPVDLTVNVSVDSDKDDDTTDGSITFTSTINGAKTLTLDASTGAVNLQGAVGGTTKLASLTVTGGQIDLSTVATTGAIAITGTNIDLNGATYNSDDGNITFTGPVDLHANVSVDSDKDDDTTDGDITFTSTINSSGSARSLTLDASTGAVNLQGAAGGSMKLTSLTVNGAQIDLDAVATTGAIAITGTNIDLNGATYESDDGDITFTGPVDLHDNVTVDSDKDDDTTDGDITFTSTVDSDVNTDLTLTLDAGSGAVDLQGAAGGTEELGVLSVVGAQIDLNTVAVTTGMAITGTNIDLNGATYSSQIGTITFTGPVDLHTNVRVNTDSDNDNLGGHITFTSTVNGAQSLTLDASATIINGAVNLQGAVGGTTKLTSLTVSGGQIDLNTVATTGAIAITGTNIDLNGATYNSDDGNITFTGAVDLHANVSVDSDKDDDTTDGDITFTSTIDSSGSARSLTLDASTGAVNLQGAAGGSMKLSSLTVNGAQIDLDAVATTGAIAITGTNIDLNGATYNSDDGDITFTGPVDVAADVSVDSDADNDGTDGDITFTSTVDDADSAVGWSLTLDADTGAVNLQGAVGGTAKPFDLTVNGGQIDVASVATRFGISIEGTNIDLNGAAYETDGGDITFTGPVDLHANVSVDSDSTNTGSGGNITFTGTINSSGSARTLTLDAADGDVDLQGAVGGTTKLTSLTVNGGQIDLNSVATTGAIAITGTNIDLNGATYNSDDGNITFTGPVDLTVNVSVDSDRDDDTTDGDITFTSTVDGAFSLTLDASTGAVNLQGALGGTSKLSTLTVNGGAVSLRSVRTTGAIAITGTGITLNGNYFSDDGNITFTGPVTLAGAVSVNSDNDNDSTDGSITFTSTINGAYSLTLDADSGAVDLPAAVGGTTKLASLTVDGGQIDLNTVATTGAIDIEGSNIDLNAATYNSDDGNVAFRGPVDLHTNVTVDSDADNDTTDGSITFTSTINSSGGARTLTLDASTGAVSLQGAVGGASKLTSLTVNGAAVSLRSVRTTGAIAVTGTGITLNGNYLSDDGNITFTGPVRLAGAVSVNSDNDNDSTDGTITFTSTVDGTYAFTLDADSVAVDLQGALGGTTKLASLTVSGAQIDLAAVATSGAIAITGTNIDLNGATYLSDDGNITFTGPVDLHTNVSMDSDADDDATDGDITFTSTIDGAYSLTLDADSTSSGAVNLQAAVGGATKLTSLTVDGGQIDLNTVATSGAIAITGSNIDLNGATYLSDNGDITFTGPVDLHTNVSADSDANDDATDGDITFTSTIDGAYSLTLDADSGAVSLQGAVGGTTKLTSLTVNGAAVSLRSVRTTGEIAVTGTGLTLNGNYLSDDGNITFTGPVTLAGAVSVNSDNDSDSTDGDITFTSTVDGAYSLALNAGSGAVELQGALGGTTKLTTFAVSGGSVSLKSISLSGALQLASATALSLGGNLSSDDGDITFTGAILLTGAVTVETDGNNDGTSGNIKFTSTVDGPHALTLNAGSGSVELPAALGANEKLASVTVDGAQIDISSVAATGEVDIEGTNIDLNGATYTSDDDNVTFRGPVDLHTNVSVDSDADDDSTDGSITFTSTVDGRYALTLNAGAGNINFNDDVGSGTQPTTITVTNANEVTVATSIRADTFRQVSGTGTTDFGFDSLYADTLVDVSTVNILGKIVTREARLTAEKLLEATIQADTLTAAAENIIADIVAKEAGLTAGKLLEATVQADTLTAAAENIIADIVAKEAGLTAGKLLEATVQADTLTAMAENITGDYVAKEASFTAGKLLEATIQADILTAAAQNIIADIVAREADLTAEELIEATIQADALKVEAQNVSLTGEIGGLGGQAAADQTLIENRGPGSYKFNDFTILGTGLGTRTYSELSALPVPGVWRIQSYPATPAAGVYTSLIPMLRTSVNESISGPYIVDVYQLPFPLLIPNPDSENYYKDFPQLFEIYPEETEEKEQEANAKIL